MMSNVAIDVDMEAKDGNILDHAVAIKQSKQASADKALHLLSTSNVVYDSQSIEARRVKRKIDMHIMPLVFTVYLLQLMDKNSLSFANIMGIRNDAKLTANQYSWLGSLVYFGYLGGDIPATFFMQRLPIAKYFSVACMLWGIVVASSAACRSFAALAVVRFLLGWLEVCTAPAVILITQAWYTKEEQVLRVALWYTTSGWTNVFGGLFAYALNHAPSFRWEGLFVLYGGLTFSIGVFCFFFLSASPTEAKWLSKEEKIIALERVRHNKTGTEIWRFNRHQLVEAFQDPRLYLIFLLLVSTGLPNGGFTAFGPSIIAEFGFDVNETTLLNMGAGGATVIITLLAFFVARWSSRTFAGLCTITLSLVGIIMMLVIDEANYKARYGGYILSQQYVVCVLFIITHMGGIGGSTKRFAINCSYQLGYAVGNILGPQTFRAKHAPNYYPAKWTMLAFVALTWVLFAALGSLHFWWNRQRDLKTAKDEREGVYHEVVANEEFLDRTDKEIPSFRYPI